jgi:acetoin utilization deacetylase AcuC-like enzyme
MRMKTGIVIDERYTEHDTGPGHPERPERIRTLLDMVGSRPAAGLVRLEPRAATEDEIALVHDARHIARVASTAGRAFSAFDADTPTGARSYATALLAAGGLVTLVDAIMAGEVQNGFAFVRPPGHHAERDRAMGFCLFNNVAIAARVLRSRHGLERVAIVDWDLHHGNGTQHAFDDDPSVLYLSTHQHPFYPGTGAAEEIGRGAGEGFTVNVPLAAGSGDPEFVEAFTLVVAPVLQQFRPEFILVSAGFDCHRRDPLGHLEATEDGIAFMARVLLRCAGDCAEGRLAAVLEGGYDLEAIRSSAARVLDRLAGEGVEEPLPGVARGPTVERVRRAQAGHWEL